MLVCWSLVCGVTVCWFFFTSPLARCVNAPTSDAPFGEMKDANCLRLARRADYTVVFMDVGTVATSRERALLFPVLLPPRLGSYGKATKDQTTTVAVASK